MAISTVLKGLTREYYFRQLFFGSLLSLFFGYSIVQDAHPNYFYLVLIMLNAILYPYARFAYEQVANFLMGNNIYFSNILIFGLLKLIFIFVCWYFAIILAPLGLIFIYFYQKKLDQEASK